MSGPMAEDVKAYVGVEIAPAYAELELWGTDQATIECKECGSGQLMKAGFRGKPFTVVDLVVAIEAHLPHCRGRALE